MYCQNCGKEVCDNAVVCINCGCEIKKGAPGAKFCYNCGSDVNEGAVVCVKCGCEINKGAAKKSKKTDDWIVVLLLCLFLGGFGAHRFYIGKMGTGVAMLLTSGGCGVWAFIDLIMILLGKFTDEKGNPITYN